MKLLSLYLDHDSSACVLDNGSIIYYSMEERLSRIKHDSGCKFLVSDLLKKKFIYFDLIIVSYIHSIHEDNLRIILDNFEYKKLIIDTENHHKFHAFSGFINSNFEESLCFVFDGGGSLTKNITNKFPNHYFKEIESVFYFNKNIKKEKLIYKHYHLVKNPHENIINYEENVNEYIDTNIKISTELSVGWKFEKFCVENGFSYFDAGKIMGLAQYKNKTNFLKNPYDSDTWKSLVDKSFCLQKETQEHVLNLILKYVKETGIKNIVISGGYALNCVANYFYLKNTTNINIFIDPICFDAGISIGSAYFYSKIYSKDSINYIKNVYIGNKDTYDDFNIDHKKYKIYKNASAEDVANLLIDQKSIAIFQGNSESGQRALGNRSIIFDPRNINAKDVLNKIKKRESYRPFAVSVLLEYVHDWFELICLNSSPYMQYAVKAKKKTIDLVPSSIHVDGTSRIQTITKDQNLIFYNIIKEFYKKTEIPMILNTSFNLAGEPLVDNLNDAIKTIDSSFIDYLYLPEIKMIISKKNSQLIF